MRLRMLSVLRHALIAVVAVSAATTTVVAHQDDNPGDLFAACLETQDPDSDQCLRALAAADLGPDFYGRLAVNREQQLNAAKHEDDLWSLVKACVETHDLRSDACHRAIETSGLTPEEFAQKVSQLLGRDKCAGTRNAGGNTCAPPCVSARNEGGSTCPAPKKDCVGTRNDGGTPCQKQEPPVLTDAVKACLALRASLAGMQAKDMVIQADRVTTVCAKAIADSGLTPAEFWAKYRSR